MDYDVTCVHQHPVAGRHALNLGAAVTGILQVAEQSVRDGIDVTMGASAGDDHMIGNGGFSDNVNVCGFFSLGIIEAGEDGIQQRFGPCTLRHAGRLCLCVQFDGLSVAKLLNNRLSIAYTTHKSLSAQGQMNHSMLETAQVSIRIDDQEC